jgi:hypothetical protein
MDSFFAKKGITLSRQGQTKADQLLRTNDLNNSITHEYSNAISSKPPLRLQNNISPVRNIDMK